MDFIQLHNHSSHSLLDGFSQIDDMAKLASEFGMSHVAVTDHGNCDGALKLMKACKDNNISPIYGCEFYIVEDANKKEKGEKRSHITIFAKTETGFQNMLKMITISNLEHFFYRPRISPEILLNHSEGLIISSACSSSFIRHEWGIKLLENLIDKQKEDIYLEIMPHLLKDQIEINNLCLELQKRYDMKLIATCDSHYLRKEDAKSQEVVLAIQANKKWSDPERWKFSGDSFYFMSQREMTREFVNQGQLDRDVFMQAMLNTVEIGEKIEFTKIEQKDPGLPRIKVDYKVSDYEYLENLCNKLFIEKNFPWGQGYKDRLDEELSLIKEKKFERYFLFVADLLNWCREQNIMVGPGRGSSGGSLVCYLLGITQIDPIKHKTLFFRFLSPERIDLPDIDTDISHIDRYKVRERLEYLYGKYNVAGVSTFSVLRGRAALRDTSRIFDVPIKDINKACAVIEKKIGEDEGSENTIAPALENFEDGKEFKEKYPEVAELAINIEGTERNRGVHAAAIVVSDNDLRDGTRCSLLYGKDKEPTINWDKNTIEYFGLVKLDILGLKMLSVLNYAKQLIKENHNVDIDYNSIDLDDPECHKEISKGNTTGCFQLGSTNIKKFCKQLGVDNFEILTAATALYRPGPLSGGFTELYVKRKNNEEGIPSVHPIYDKITKDTFGVIVYQEQVMQIINELAGLDWITTDKIRKMIAKSKGKDALRNFETQFVEGCIKQKTLREDRALMLWDEIVGFGQYAFNLSHSVAYSHLTVWDMYLKINYPQEFICALLTYGTDNDDMRDEYIEEAFRLGIDIRPPKIGISFATEYRIYDGRIYLPFSSIKGVGEITAKNFEKLGQEDNGFVEKKKPVVSKKFMNVLDKIGAYEDKELSDVEADNVSQYLSISLVKNKLYKYKKLIKLVSSNLNISNVKDINLSESEQEYKYYFGLVTELNLTVKNGKNGKYNVANISFKDTTGECKISIDSVLYQNKVSEIEHCENQIIILRANSPKRAGSLIAVEAWFQEDILSGELDSLFLGLAETKRFFVEGVSECQNCKLLNSPQPMKSGRYNIMIVSETAKDNDDFLYRELRKYSFEDRDFYRTSVIKCNVPGKNITRKDVEECSEWLDKEIEGVRPFLILSIGNVGLKYFTEEDTGVQTKNSICEWNEQYGCWVIYCLSPASTYYEQNIKPFKQTIKIFSDKIKNLGLITF